MVECAIYGSYAKALGNLYVRDLTPGTIQKWLLGLKRTNGKRKGEALSPTTARHALNAVRTVLDFGVEMDYLEKNPARSQSVRPKELVKRTIRPFETWQEVFLVAGKAGDHGPTIRFACGSGLREGEWIALRWEDVDFRSGECHVRQTVSDGVSVPTAPGGGMVNATNFRNRVFYPALDAAELSRRWPSECRHTYATLSISARPDLLAWVSKQMGHKTPETTMRFYRAWLPREDSANVDAMNDAIEAALDSTGPETAPLAEGSEE